MEQKRKRGSMEKASYLKRFAFCILGLVLYGFGCFLGVKAGAAGTNAWSTLAIGVSDISGMSYGTATFLISLLIIGIDFLGKGKIGFGTLMNATLVSFFADVFLSLTASIPSPSSMLAGALCSLAGQVVISFATILYLLPSLGAGPRDTLMIIVGKKFPKAPIGSVKLGVEVMALLPGLLLGAPFGLGTVLVMVLQASIFQFACKITRYEPCSVSHEDIPETCRRMAGKH